MYDKVGEADVGDLAGVVAVEEDVSDLAGVVVVGECWHAFSQSLWLNMPYPS